MAVDAAYFEPTVEVNTERKRGGGESSFCFYARGTADLTPHRRVSSHSHAAAPVSSRGEVAMSVDLPSFTAAMRDAYVGAPMPRTSAATSKYEDLANQHGALVVKQFEGGGLTSAEQKQLRLLKWALDTIEMERMEPSLKHLQDLVQMQRKLKNEVDRLVAVMR